MSSPTKDNEILRYYEAEMRYLREAGKEFARAFPDRARELDIDRIGERDPHVERLFEGFAFLMGRLRHKLDDELPELTEGLVSMLWPHYLRMIPSLSILELTPNAGAMQKHEVVEAGLEATSDPIATGLNGTDEAQIECVYRTTQPVDLYPLTLSEAGAYAREDDCADIAGVSANRRSLPVARAVASRAELPLAAQRGNSAWLARAL